MNFVIFALLLLSCTLWPMETKEQLKKELINITFNGRHTEFAKKCAAFQGLEYDDLLKAKQQCDRRLLALKDISHMYSDTRIKDLVIKMQEEMKESKECLFAYIDEAEKRYNPSDRPEQECIFSAAAEILRSIELRAISYTGNFLVDLQAKLAQEQHPLKFLATETANTRYLQSKLKEILRNKIGYQLHQIVFAGNLEAFQQNQEQFKRELDALDLVRAKENCKFRLAAVEGITKMRTNPRFNLLVMSMAQDQEPDEGTSISKYCQHYPWNEVKAAREIDNATFPHSAIYNECFADIKEKIANERNPEQYLEKEKHNILQLRDALQNIIPDMPGELINRARQWGTLRFTKDFFTLAE